MSVVYRIRIPFWCCLPYTITTLSFQYIISLHFPPHAKIFSWRLSGKCLACVLVIFSPWRYTSSCFSDFLDHNVLIYFIFNYRITVQYCDAFFFAIHQHELVIGLHMYPPFCTPLSPPSSFHPSRLSQSTGFGFPASCRKLPLAIYFTYGNMHVSMLFFQITPPSAFPTVSKNVMPLLPPLCSKHCVCVSLLSCI